MKEEIIGLIRKGKTEEALNLSLDYYSESNEENNQMISLLLNQFNNLKRKKLLGLEEKNEHENRIVKALIEIISESSKTKYSEEKIISEAKQLKSQEEEQQAKRLIKRIYQFCKSAYGYWLSYGANAGVLGFVSLKIDKARITLQMRGEAYNSDGELIYQWKSIGSSIDLENEKLNYIWEGYAYKRDEETKVLRATEPKNRGWGEVSFKNIINGRFESAVDQFSDTELKVGTELKVSRFKRCNSEVIEIVDMGESKRIGKLVSQLINGVVPGSLAQ